MLKLLGAAIIDFYNALSNLGSIFFIETMFFKENSLNKRLVFLHRCMYSSNHAAFGQRMFCFTERIDLGWRVEQSLRVIIFNYRGRNLPLSPISPCNP